MWLVSATSGNTDSTSSEKLSPPFCVIYEYVPPEDVTGSIYVGRLSLSILDKFRFQKNIVLVDL